MTLINMTKKCFMNTDNKDKHWYQYVLDHREILRSSSRFVFVTADDLNMYQYNIERYLQETGRKTQLAWIICTINPEIKSEIDFRPNNNISGLYIPDDETIKLHYQQYCSAVKNKV